MIPFVSRKYARPLQAGEQVLVRDTYGRWVVAQVIEYRDRRYRCRLPTNEEKLYRWPWPIAFETLVIQPAAGGYSAITAPDAKATIRLCEDAAEARDFLAHINYVTADGTHYRPVYQPINVNKAQ